MRSMPIVAFSIALELIGIPAAARAAYVKPVAQLKVTGSDVICIGVQLGEVGGSTQSGEQYCDVTAKLSLLNRKLAYYSYTDSPFFGSSVTTYFFYSGVFEFRFRCDVTASNDEGEKRMKSLVLRRVLFLQGGYTYTVTPLLKAGSTSCKVQVQERRTSHSAA